MDVDRLSRHAAISATFARITLRAAAHRLRSAAELLHGGPDHSIDVTTDLPNDNTLKAAQELATNAIKALVELEQTSHEEPARQVILRAAAGQLRNAADLVNTEFEGTVDLFGSQSNPIADALELASTAVNTIATYRIDSANASDHPLTPKPE